jgi:aryl-alcohol dehydrogenase-like predicted oxidoreductase
VPEAHPGLGGIPLVFGGNVFGWTLDRDASFAVLDAFYEEGGRMIDSADGYSAWIPGNKGGESEAIIGEWLENRGVRAEMRIATKTGMGGIPGGLRPEKVEAAIAASLERLRTGYVDLYYAHRHDPETPLDEVVSVYDAILKRGQARELAASNHTAEQLQAVFATAARLGCASYSVLQPQYNLVWRQEYEGPLQDLCVKRGIAVLPYYGLASGFLTGKFRSADDWAGSSRAAALAMFADNGGWARLAILEQVAARRGVSPAQVALAWLRSRAGVVAPIASATSPEQVRELCASARLELHDEDLAKLAVVKY